MEARKRILLIMVLLLAFAAYRVFWGETAKTITECNIEPVFVIDPGHGGEDGGAVGADGVLESGINLAIGLRTDRLLGFFGYSCILTRNSEELNYPSGANTVRKRKQADLEDRAKLVNSTDNAVLVSIHQNKYPTSQPRGAQILYRNDEDSSVFSESMQSVLLEGLGDSVRSPTVAPDSIYLMRSVNCPGILVECGFLSNPAELSLLRSEEYQLRLALCLACGCTTYAAEWEKKYGQGGKG